MKIISTKTHGVLDYLMGAFLIVSPWVFGFANGSPAQSIPVILGVIMIVMSLFTNYEAGLFKSISMRTHLTMDIMSGIFLLLSPWLFNFYEVVYLPHLILGLAEVGAALMTSSIPYKGTGIREDIKSEPKGARGPEKVQKTREKEPV